MKKLLLVLSLIVALGPAARAAFLTSGATARIVALGGSYVALADDAASVTMNPAGLSRAAHPEVVADYSRPYTGLGDGSNIAQYYLGYAQPLSIGGSVGLGFQQLQFDGLYTERTLSLGYGRWFTSCMEKPKEDRGVSRHKSPTSAE